MSSLPDKIYRRVLRPFDAFYYRFLVGRIASWDGALGRGVLAREQRSGRGDVPLPRQQWEEQYGEGQWDFLEQSDEAPRYTRIAEMVRSAESLLDVGCGEGILLDYLDPLPERYLGIDLSRTAIEKATKRSGSAARFEAADAESFSPQEPFEAIVLNECLYYFHDPVAQAHRYFEMVPTGGAMIVSMFQHRRSSAIARQLDRELSGGETLVLNQQKGSWIVARWVR